MKHPFLLFIYSILFSFSSYTQAQVITTVAGNGTAGHTGDGGPAIIAELNYPIAVVIDGTGNMFIADFLSNRIRKISSSGIITTIAGNGIGGYSGDGVAATSVELYNPSGIALDQSGNLYIADLSNNRIRKVDTTGIITTIAGSGTPGYSGDGGVATAAQLHNPAGITTDGSGNIYFADGYNQCIRKVNPAAGGIITTIAGNGTSGFSGDGFPATAAQLNGTAQVKTDNAGNLYISDCNNYRIRKVDQSSGIIVTIAGNGTPGYSGDRGPATACEFNQPQGLAFDNIGNLYIADELNHSIRKINIAGIITTIAGTGTAGYSGDGGQATVAELNRPESIATDDTGNVYIADFNNNRVRKISSGNHIPSIIGGAANTLTVCKNTMVAPINSLLTVGDADTGQTETWTLMSGAFYGTAVVAYTTSSTGSLLTPVGLSYTPNTGYIGNDTFTVRVDDHISVATITIYVTVNAFPNAGTIAGPDTLCTTMASIILTDTVTGGIWSRSNASATVAGGVVSEITTGRDTIYYMLTNSCGIDTATHVVSIVNCPAGVNAFPGLSEAAVNVHPNPNNGTFTVTVVSAKDEPADVVITNMVGENVTRFTTTSDKPVSIPLNVPAGVYFLTATTAHYQWNTKIVVQ